jgi:phosphoglycerate dehydrogenase-like enzyme
MNPACVIMSAKGEKSFSPAQVKELKENLDVKFLSVLKPLDTEEFIRLAKDAEILAVTRRSIKDFNRRIIDALPKLKSLAIYSTGYEWVDMEYIREKNILVSFLPEYCTVSVAEHTLAMILTMMSRTHLSYDKVRGLIPDEISLRGFELRDKCVGIIGLGRIGSEIAGLLQAMHTNVSYFDIRDIKNPVVPFKPRSMLLEQSDIIEIGRASCRERV